MDGQRREKSSWQKRSQAGSTMPTSDEGQSMYSSGGQPREPRRRSQLDSPPRKFPACQCGICCLFSLSPRFNLDLGSIASFRARIQPEYTLFNHQLPLTTCPYTAAHNTYRFTPTTYPPRHAASTRPNRPPTKVQPDRRDRPVSPTLTSLPYSPTHSAHPALELTRSPFHPHALSPSHPSLPHHQHHRHRTPPQRPSRFRRERAPQRLLQRCRPPCLPAPLRRRRRRRCEQPSLRWSLLAEESERW